MSKLSVALLRVTACQIGQRATAPVQRQHRALNQHQPVRTPAHENCDRAPVTGMATMHPAKTDQIAVCSSLMATRCMDNCYGLNSHAKSTAGSGHLSPSLNGLHYHRAQPSPPPSRSTKPAAPPWKSSGRTATRAPTPSSTCATPVPAPSATTSAKRAIASPTSPPRPPPPDRCRCSSRTAPHRSRPGGNYAIRFTWNDGHEHGIYSWDYLREWCPCSLPRHPSLHRRAEARHREPSPARTIVLLRVES